MNYASAKSIRRDVLELLPPPKRLPMSQNVAELLRVEMNGSMVPWDATLTPYVLEPLNCLDSRRYDAVVLVAPARTGKSVALVDGWLLNSITRDRADHLLVQVSQEKAAEHSKRRLQRAFQASPEVKAALSTNKHDNAIHEIKTKAGNFLKCGWPSKNIFSSSDWKRVILTDLDRMPLDIGGEGSPFMLASKRTQTFMSSGMVMAESSPAHAITDLAYRPKSSHESPPTNGILSIYNQGDRRLYMWQCPSCGEFSEPLFERLVWDANQKDPNLASKDVSYCCPECGDTFREDQRIDKVPFKIHANNGGIWLPEGCSVDQDRVVTGTPRDSRIASFWMKGGVTSAFQSWSQLIFKYVGAMNEYEETGLTETLQTVVNTDMGMPFAPPRSSENSADGLMARRSDLGTKMVPPDVRFLLASVDVQGGSRSRFVVQIEGYGVGLESTIIDRFEIEKSDRKDGNDPDKFVRVKPHQYAEDWQVLVRKVIQATYEIDDGSGRRMGIAKTACDSAGEGGTTSN
ncbi:MAG: terminase gpA endonuclease subunit, partial [Shewanella sp.]